MTAYDILFYTSLVGMVASAAVLAWEFLKPNKEDDYE